MVRLFAGTQWDVPPQCDRCGLDLDECNCPPEPRELAPELPPEKQKLTIRKEKRKKGKLVTTVSGLKFQDPGRFKQVLKDLKDSCGTGGTLEGEVLVLQGDLVERLEAELRQHGFSIKLIR